MSDLRKKVIRLAHETPELRPHLLPLLKTKQASGKSSALMKAVFKGLPQKAKQAALLGLKREVEEALRFGDEPQTYEEACESLTFLVVKDNERALKSAALKAFEEAVEREYGEAHVGSYVHVTIDDDFELKFSGKFYGSDYLDEDPDNPVEVPSDDVLHLEEIYQAVKKLGGRLIRSDYHLEDHDSYDDMGQIVYDLSASFKFNPEDIAHTVTNKRTIEAIVGHS